jgi:tetratricopeptide (TPR) repeat protein
VCPALRAAAYVPFLQGNFEEAIAMLTDARTVVADLVFSGQENQAVRDDNLHSILESTMKVHMASGNLMAAREAAQQLVALEPWDSKCHLELGNICYSQGDLETAQDAYLEAAFLGPPGTEIAAFLGGHCLERLGKPQLAMHAYLASLAADPDGISSKDGLIRCATLTAAREAASRV